MEAVKCVNSFVYRVLINRTKRNVGGRLWYHRLHPVDFSFPLSRKVKPHRLKPVLLKHSEETRSNGPEDPGAAVILACALEDASVLRPLLRPRLPQRIRFVFGRRTIPLPHGGGARPQDSFGLLPRWAGRRIRTRFRTATGGRDPPAPMPVQPHPAG